MGPNVSVYSVAVMLSYRLNWYECQNLIDNLFQFLKVLLSLHMKV